MQESINHVNYFKSLKQVEPELKKVEPVKVESIVEEAIVEEAVEEVKEIKMLKKRRFKSRK